MTATTVSVTCDISQVDAAEFAGARLDFKPSSADYDTAGGDTFPAHTVSVELDASGVGVADLWPVDLGTRNSHYSVTLVASIRSAVNGAIVSAEYHLGTIRPQSGTTPNLADLLAQSSGGVTVGSTIYATLADAVAAAVAASVVAENSSNQATVAALAAGAPIVTSLPSPVPADDTIVILQTVSGGVVYQVEGGSWVSKGSLSQPIDATSVAAAGAVMDSELTSLTGVKTLTVPDNTTVSAFGASLIDDASSADALVTLGLTATAAELNYADGVTSPIQDQLDGKANTSHTHSIANVTGLQTALDARPGRNLIINGSGRINQRGYVSGTATVGSNKFTLDRWFVVTSGQSLTFTGTGAGRTMTAPAGGVAQVIEGANIVGGTYVINWTGTATCTVNGVSRSKGDTFTLTANTNTTVRFSSGTFTDVQLELGTVATPFDHVDIGLELAKCQRYFFKIAGDVLLQSYNVAGGASTYSNLLFPTPMRSAPTASTTFTGGVNNASQTVTTTYLGFMVTLTGLSGGDYAVTYATGNTFDAELIA